jgi:hypothetical protein
MERCRSGLLLVLLAVARTVYAGGPPTPNAFPLVGWWGPPATEEHLQAYREAHFNIVQIPGDPGNGNAIRLASKAGLQVMLIDPKKASDRPRDWAAFANSFDNVMGWLLQEQMPLEAAPKTLAMVKEARLADPARLALITLPAPESPQAWAEAAGTLFEAGLPVLCYQRPAFLNDGTTDEAGFYHSLELASRLARRHNVPIWGMVEVTKHGQYRDASESDLRLQAYSYLAYGAKGLCYYTYWASPPDNPDSPDADSDSTRGMIDPKTGKREFAWELVEQLNRELLVLAPVLANLKPVSAHFVGDVPQGLASLPHGKTLLDAISAERGLVGFLADAQGQSWVLLVNRRHGERKSAAGQKSTFEVFPNKRVTRIVEVDRLTAYEKEIPIEDGSFLITIPGGTGSLLRLEITGAAPCIGLDPVG